MTCVVVVIVVAIYIVVVFGSHRKKGITNIIPLTFISNMFDDPANQKIIYQQTSL